VAEQCTAGQFVPKINVKMGLAIDSDDSSAASIQSNLTAMGYSYSVYSDADVAAGRLISDGVNVLMLARTAVLAPASPEYIAAIREYVFLGGSLLGEYDGAALAFTSQDGSSGVAIMNNINPSLGIFEGVVAGGGALLPLESSRTYVTDGGHPIMTGMPVNFLNGIRTAFAVTGYDDQWLSVEAQFTSTGYNNLVPVGTYPAVMSARCGGGRVVLYTMNYFQVLNQSTIQTLVRNSLQWASGQE
jgi:hypothetical protein